MKHNWKAYAQLMRLDKPVGIYLLLWPTLWALLMAAQGLPPLEITVIFVAGVVVMRSAGCVINDYADRNVDGRVKRTTQRLLATGEATPKQALQLFGALIVIAFILVLFLNWQTIALSVVALMLAASYPFMKRYTHLPQVVLGAAFGWSIPMAFMAVQETVPTYAWWLFIANLLWTVAYDTMYAMVDRDDDLQIGVKSTAILFGKNDVLIVMLLQACALIILWCIGCTINATWPYYTAVLFSALLCVRQYQLIKRRQREGCFTAFIENHYIGLAITLGTALHFYLVW
ncbi:MULTISPECIES: 4-hydroxybenzoate octaprenyltransferase [Alteromonas]|uniref:4-hydroxybenzoate octaprenyltransferase n=2 Tax=Alteromonas mediterranea TaxID=314275 RepID=A0AAC9ACA5_9ALTE|nr:MULTISPECIES: 4-hydroxybenzoate octaprenyltransferase [Alteromonas]AGP91818.1 4-hydroxybenzoate octaprenyltransferase [Alteromonas mediterranea U8]MBR9895265.1 4-hydroxybenzoate octaprenyltransferase [Gammaproteobacteria bacterium]MDY6883248.1 4-hydroxybenzoate octaprenyltransferase [Pseudomonadota bacterium]AEA96218.1 4-hydroxybenzoate polyprenyltransferase [Alteromonas mediterranea DE]AFV83600.1 4-hydroxybenzoate octaprenyltransferase [Alteromonas mediterranea DE1]|tara:strand:- start:5846 stop:6706 length:861 start_codon:yes stop_codon:yes gene_type:complete